MSRASDVMGANAPIWLSDKVYKPGDVLKSPADRYQLYVRTSAAGSGTTDPSADPGNYTPFGGRAVKSIQRGVIAFVLGGTTATATITAVVTAKAELRFGGSTAGAASSTGSGFDSVYIRLSNATTVTATRASGLSSAGGVDGSVAWELTEYF